MLRQRFAVIVAAAVSIALVAVFVFGTRGLLHLRSLTAEEATIRQRIAVLLTENQRLRSELHQLRHDDRYLERLAREQLGFVRPGEVVYRFPDSGRPLAAPPR